jgi:hypothetical protein
VNGEASEDWQREMREDGRVPQVSILIRNCLNDSVKDKMGRTHSTHGKAQNMHTQQFMSHILTRINHLSEKVTNECSIQRACDGRSV